MLPKVAKIITSNLASLLAVSIVLVPPLVMTSCSDDQPVNTNISLRPAGDKELAHVAAEAREKFDQFVTAFKMRKAGDKSVFNVKFPVRDKDNTEHFWMEVHKLDGDEISGNFDSDGISVETVHAGDAANTTADQIEDWNYYDGAVSRGLFSMRVLQKDSIANINNFNRSNLVKEEEDKIKLLQHWKKLESDASSKNPATLTEADKLTFQNIQLVQRFFKGNNDRDATNEEIGAICGLPPQLIEFTRKCGYENRY